MGKDYPGTLDEELQWIAKKKIRSYPEKIDRQNLTHFAMMLDLFEDGDEDDEKLKEFFRAAKLDYRDVFHWWELLHAFSVTHSSKPSRGARIWTDEFKRKLVSDCVKVGVKLARPTIPLLCEGLKADHGYRQTPENLQAQIARNELRDKIMKKITAAKKKAARR